VSSLSLWGQAAAPILVTLGGINKPCVASSNPGFSPAGCEENEPSDAALCQAVVEMAQGLIDADLGGGLVKKRIALPRRGKSGGARTLVATNKGSRWIFVFGFEKNDRANITAEELQALKDLAHDILSNTAVQLAQALEDGALQEICHEH
jgi:hypothetical protein